MKNDIVNIDEIKSIENRVIMINDKPVLLDTDVAQFYQVETRIINQAVKNNPNKFPDGYILDLSVEETNSLRSKFLILEKSGKGEHSKYGAKAFTERGLYMLATILKGEGATRVTLKIIDTFARFREITNNLNLAGNTKDEKEKGGLLKKSGLALIDLMTDNMQEDESIIKTTIKLELGIFKVEKITERDTK